MKTSILMLLPWVFLTTNLGCRSEYTGPLFPASINGKIGYINITGGMVIPARYENGRNFSEGMAAAAMNGRWGYIDRKGNWLIQPLHRSAGEFHKGLAIVDSGLPERPMGLIDSSGTWVVPPTFRTLKLADETADLYLGQIDPAGEEVYYDRSGQVVSTPVLALHVSLLQPVYQDKKMGYQSASGKLMVTPRWEEGGQFKEGLAPVREGMNWFFIDTAGNVVVQLPPNVRHAMPLSGGRSLVTADRDVPGRKLGYLDRQGNWAIPPVWDDAEPFMNGLARVGDWKSNTVAYINPEGKIVWKGTAP